MDVWSPEEHVKRRNEGHVLRMMLYMHQYQERDVEENQMGRLV